MTTQLSSMMPWEEQSTRYERIGAAAPHFVLPPDCDSASADLDSAATSHGVDDLCPACRDRALRYMAIARRPAKDRITGDLANVQPSWASIHKCDCVDEHLRDCQPTLVMISMWLCVACDERFAKPCRCQPKEHDA